jgi:glycosyltransferase involved in cell wall biosynthesis
MCGGGGDRAGGGADLTETRPGISIVIPTHNRVECLGRCLARLGDQQTRESTEIIVVDDGSDAAEEVAELVASLPGARLIRLDTQQGPAAARNAGARAARGSVVCFTDDDCEPDSEWAQTLADAVRRGADVAAGATRDGAGGNRFARALHVQVEHFAHESGVPFAASNNIAAQSALLLEVPFDSLYRGAAEDRDWCARLAKHGFRIEHEPAAGLYHNQQLTLAGYLRKQARYGRGSWRYHRWSSRRPFERPAFYFTLLRRGFGESPAIGVLVAVGQAALAVGYLHEWQSSRRNGAPQDLAGSNS